MHIGEWSGLCAIVQSVVVVDCAMSSTGHCVRARASCILVIASGASSSVKFHEDVVDYFLLGCYVGVAIFRLGRFGGISRWTLILFSDVCYIFFNL